MLHPHGVADDPFPNPLDFQDGPEPIGGDDFAHEHDFGALEAQANLLRRISPGVDDAATGFARLGTRSPRRTVTTPTVAQRNRIMGVSF